jgi:TatD family-associated radical SAM protein
MGENAAYRIDGTLYLNVTNTCTLECTFCPKTRGHYTLAGFDLQLPERPTAAELIELIDDPASHREVVFSGLGEPTMRLGLVLEVARAVKAGGGHVHLETDGLANLVHRDDVLPGMSGLVDALSVSMNAHDEETYERWCRPNLPGSFDAMLAFLREAPAHVPRVCATVIDGLPGVDLDACERLAHSLGAEFRRRSVEA